MPRVPDWTSLEDCKPKFVAGIRDVINATWHASRREARGRGKASDREIVAAIKRLILAVEGCRIDEAGARQLLEGSFGSLGSPPDNSGDV